MLNGLIQLNVELTSRCDKANLCHFCGHQDPAVHPTLRFGEMSLDLLGRLVRELLPLGRSLVVQFHRDGDPLALGCGPAANTFKAFAAHIRSVVTHGERLGEEGYLLTGHCESLTVSIFRGDPDRARQLDSLRRYLAPHGMRFPKVFLKVVGDMSDDELLPYTALQVPIMRRIIHTPMGNSKYAHHTPTMPEHGICLDLLHHPSVAWDGHVYLCNRLDTADKGLIGNLNEESLDAIWNGKLRAEYIQKHLDGRRADVPPCADCRYYGIPTQ